MTGVVEDDKECNLGHISISNDVNVRASLCGDFAAIQSPYRELSIPVPENGGTVFWFALQVLDTLYAADETKARVVALEATETELSARVHLLEGHDRRLIYENHRLEHQTVILNVDKQRGEAGESVDRRSIPDTMVELANVKEAMHAHEERASADRSMRLSAFDDLNDARINWQQRPQRCRLREGSKLWLLINFRHITAVCEWLASLYKRG